MTEWYELEEDERVKKVYAKYTLADFWKWWSRGQPATMEIRIKDFTKIKILKEKYNFPISASGVYVQNVDDIKRILKEYRNDTTLWFGVNPKKKSYDKRGWWNFNGEDHGIKEIGYIFIDIDRVTKIKPATTWELKNANYVADQILERLNKYKWSESYIKICSGHGVQLLIKLDYPIELPTPAVNSKKQYEYNEEYETLKKLVKRGIGAEIVKFARKFKDEYMVEVDASGMNMGRVAALPMSKNLKYDTQRWRAIVEIKDGINEGLTDYIYTKIKDLKTFKKKNAFSKPRAIPDDHKLKKGKMLENPLVRLFLDYDLPKGDKHMTIGFALRMLIKDSGFTFQDKEVQEVIHLIEQKYGHFQRAMPADDEKFNTGIVNNFCFKHRIPPVYPLWPDAHDNRFPIDDTVKWSDIIAYPPTNIMEFDEEKDIRSDIRKCINLLDDNDIEKNTLIYIEFVRNCIKRYGIEQTKYFFDNKIIYKGLKRGMRYEENKK